MRYILHCSSPQALGGGAAAPLRAVRGPPRAGDTHREPGRAGGARAGRRRRRQEVNSTRRSQ